MLIKAAILNVTFHCYWYEICERKHWRGKGLQQHRRIEYLKSHTLSATCLSVLFSILLLLFCAHRFHPAKDQFMCTLQRSDADIGALYDICGVRVHQHHQRSRTTEIFNIIIWKVVLRFRRLKHKSFHAESVENSKFCANISFFRQKFEDRQKEQQLEEI